MPSPITTSSSSLSNAIQEHILKEKASFHVPGHKSYAWQSDGSFISEPILKYDLTELPGLDELAYPSGIIADLEQRAAQAWHAHSTLLSVNGATAGNLATILMLARRGTHLLIPRNCHRSVIHALILSGLNPIWFEPQWQCEWGFWGAPDSAQLSNILKDTFAKNPQIQIAGLFVTSPTYTGALADLRSLSELCDIYKLPLIVDEAWGGHLYWTEQYKQAALNCVASIVIHSLHKTLSGPTQTGLVHISEKGAAQFGFSAIELRACMNLIQSSSPSYLFMGEIDKLVTALLNGKAKEQIGKTETLSKQLNDFIAAKTDLTLYEPNFGRASTHFLIKHKYYDAQQLQDFLISKGIFPEANAGQGTLLLLGIGSQRSDLDQLQMAWGEIIAAPAQPTTSSPKIEDRQPSQPPPIDQLISPREAFLMPSHIVPVQEAIGQISADCLAPCPPGWTILVPGQRITEEILRFNNIKSVRIIKRT